MKTSTVRGIEIALIKKGPCRQACPTTLLRDEELRHALARFYSCEGNISKVREEGEVVRDRVRISSAH